MTKIYQVANIIEKIAPKSLSFQGDNNGLQFGFMDANVHNILVTLEITKDVIIEAISNKCDLIIAHHPFIFNSISTFNPQNPKTEMITRLLEKKIAVYIAHSNMDASLYSMNFLIAKKIGIKNTLTLSPVKIKNFKKLVIYIPDTHIEKIRDKLLTLELFKTDKYSKMSFMTEGEGTFLPFTHAMPFIGEPGKIEKTKEFRLEVLIDEKNINSILNEIRNIHPYEEMAYDIYPVEFFYPGAGHGVYGQIDEKELLDLASLIKSKLNIPFLKIVGESNKKIKKVGIISGSGASYITQANELDLDVLITGDVKHHDAHLALEYGLSIIDAGHYHTEKFFTDIIVNLLKENIKSKINLIKSKINTQPFEILN